VYDRSKRETYTQKQTRSYTKLYVEHVCNSGTTLWNSGEEGKEKKMIRCQQNIIHNICDGRGYNDMYWQLLKNGGWEVKGKGE
jgi:hypothetical protein